MADRARRTPYFTLAVICRGIAARAAAGAMRGCGFDEVSAWSSRTSGPASTCRQHLDRR
jgi:hypothetical protein